jgi:hypothetical protein
MSLGAKCTRTWAGPTFDPKAKTHPNLLPWSQLPPSVKVKAKIFDIIAKAAKSLSE